jgi:MYXO-CTERM domain-containing protein
MNLKLGLSALAASTAITSVSSAAIFVFNQQTTWETFAGVYGDFIFTEDFNDIADGGYASPFAHSTGPVNWSATAGGGLFVNGGVFSTNLPETLTFNFSGAPLNGVGGNFFATDISFNLVPALIFVTLNDGTSYAGVITSTSTFTGFYSNGAAITSIAVQAFSSGAPVYPSVDNLKFATAVPAPGALALLGLAGLVGGRRRR